MSPATGVVVSDSPKKGTTAQTGNAFNYGTGASSRPSCRDAKRHERTAQAASGFLTGSAMANRDVLNRQPQAAPRFERDVNASFARPSTSGLSTGKGCRPGMDVEMHSDGPSGAKDSHRDGVLRVIEELTIGPKQVLPSEKDPHFMQLEPNSGTALRTRFVPHLQVQDHLDGRYYVPISKLYAICLPGVSDDGDYTVPIDGDWLTIGVVTHKTERRETQGCMLDWNWRRIDEKQFEAEVEAYKNRKGDGSSSLDGSEDPYKRVRKIVPSTAYITFTLVDLGQPLSGHETSGDSTLQLTVYKADESRLDEGGVRRYKGGSGGAYEALETLGLGTVLCVLNPLIKKSKPGKSSAETTQDPFLALRPGGAAQMDDNTDKAKGHGDGGKMLRIQPRTGDSIMMIGTAADYAQCGAMCRNGMPCDHLVDRRTRMKACPFHTENSAQHHRNARQEFANGTSALGHRNRFASASSSSHYSLSDGLTFASQSKAYVFQGRSSDSGRKTDPSSRQFRVEERYGRDREARKQRERQLLHEEDMCSLLAKKAPSQSKDNSALHSRHHSDLPTADIQSIATPSSKRTHGAMAIEDAMRKLQQSKYSSSRGLQKSNMRYGKRSRSDSAAESSQLQDKAQRKREIGAESSSSKEAEFGKPSQVIERRGAKSTTSLSSSKLLARHTAPTASRSKPILRLKSAKGSSSVRPPPGQSFYPLDGSDDELDGLLASGALDSRASLHSDDSDLEIVE